jgi:hypothetical protein
MALKFYHSEKQQGRIPMPLYQEIIEYETSLEGLLYEDFFKISNNQIHLDMAPSDKWVCTIHPTAAFPFWIRRFISHLTATCLLHQSEVTLDPNMLSDGALLIEEDHLRFSAAKIWKTLNDSSAILKQVISI